MEKEKQLKAFLLINNIKNEELQTRQELLKIIQTKFNDKKSKIVLKNEEIVFEKNGQKFGVRILNFLDKRKFLFAASSINKYINTGVLDDKSNKIQKIKEINT